MKELETVVQDEKNKWILITGILQVLACVIMNKFDISNPNIILFVILSAVLVQFGYGAGMLCGFITYIYSMYFFSTDHSFFYFDASNRDKIMVVIFGIIANILIVGSLKARMEKSNKERIHQLEVATTLNKCAVELSADRDIHTAIYNLLGIINQYFQADRSYIFDIDHEKQIVINTYEYTAEGVTRQIDNLQSVPLSVIAVWMDKFENGQVYYIADAEQEKGYPTYEMLVEQNIKRLLTVPLKKNGKVTGFIGVDNPKVHFDDATLLLSLQYFIVNSQSSQRQQERLQFLSFRDMLTGLYNRNKYMKVLETFEKYPVCDTGVAYIDLNGLKQINDNLGHEAGDVCLLQTIFLTNLNQLEEVIQRRVNTTGRSQAHQVELLTCLLSIAVSVDDFLILQDVTALASLVDLNEVLIYHTTSTDVEVTYLRVTHLTVRKTYVLATSLESRMC